MRKLKLVSLIGFYSLLLVSCTKQVGTNTNLAYTDKALADSCLNAAKFYYLNNSNTLYTGNNGPHGEYKLRFNSIAFKALVDNGRLPNSTAMPNGALIVKDVYKGNQIALFAMMYKKDNNWLWAEYQTNKEIVYSVNKNPGLCINCHSQPGNRDLILSFKYY